MCPFTNSPMARGILKRDTFATQRAPSPKEELSNAWCFTILFLYLHIHGPTARCNYHEQRIATQLEAACLFRRTTAHVWMVKAISLSPAESKQTCRAELLRPCPKRTHHLSLLPKGVQGGAVWFRSNPNMGPVPLVSQQQGVYLSTILRTPPLQASPRRIPQSAACCLPSHSCPSLPRTAWPLMSRTWSTGRNFTVAQVAAKTRGPCPQSKFLRWRLPC